MDHVDSGPADTIGGLNVGARKRIEIKAVETAKQAGLNPPALFGTSLIVRPAMYSF